MPQVAILVVMLGAQNHIAEKGQVVVFFDVPRLGLFGDRTQNHHLAAGLFKSGKIKVEKGIGGSVDTLKASKKKRPLSSIETPYASTRAAGHGQPLQI